MFDKEIVRKKIFKCIGIVGIPRRIELLKIHKEIYDWLVLKNYDVIIEKKIAEKLNITNSLIGGLDKISKIVDLIIVIGGDGNMLSVARMASYNNNKVIGVNCGNLGFLTDLKLKDALKELEKILFGDFFEEKRFLLEIKIFKGKSKIFTSTAINEIIVYRNQIAKMIKFLVYIDDSYAFSQYSDGLIITTPTGSTAYSLSAGGPILTPNVNAISLVPMFSHKFSSRPLVINGDSIIKLKFNKKVVNYKISCDTHIFYSISKDDEVIIRKSKKTFYLIHPKKYNYFNMLNLKLGWLR